MSEMNISWMLEDDFDKQTHLFTNIIKTNYKVVAYSCKCGHLDFVIKHKNDDENNYYCKECENTTFYNAEQAIKSTYFFVSNNKELFSNLQDLKYKVYSDDTQVYAYYYFDVPAVIDFQASRLLSQEVPLYKLSLDKFGEIEFEYAVDLKKEIYIFYELYNIYYDAEYYDSTYSENDNYADQKEFLAKLIIKHIQENGIFDVNSILYHDKLSFLEMSYFLKRLYLKDQRLYKCSESVYFFEAELQKEKNYTLEKLLEKVRCSKEQKSIKKAIFQDYEYQVTENNSYYCAFKYAFCTHIEDVNILKSLIELPLEEKYSDRFDGRFFNDFMSFLKIHYTQKQILEFFKQAAQETNISILKDTIEGFIGAKTQEIIGEFVKVACTLMCLHDEFTRLHVISQKKYLHFDFEYTKEQTQKCLTIDQYSVKLPRTGVELDQFAHILHNCMTMYAQLIYKKQTIIYCFFKEKNLSFAVEMKNNTVVQASAQANRELTEEQKKVLKVWLERTEKVKFL